MRQEFEYRLYYCIEVNDEHFEQKHESIDKVKGLSGHQQEGTFPYYLLVFHAFLDIGFRHGWNSRRSSYLIAHRILGFDETWLILMSLLNNKNVCKNSAGYLIVKTSLMNFDSRWLCVL